MPSFPLVPESGTGAYCSISGVPSPGFAGTEGFVAQVVGGPGDGDEVGGGVVAVAAAEGEDDAFHCAKPGGGRWAGRRELKRPGDCHTNSRSGGKEGAAGVYAAGRIVFDSGKNFW